MTDGDVEIAYRHITEFYRGTNIPGLQKWMSDFSTSMEAWTICDRILGERKDPLCCCFAAQTLRQKILKALKEIPDSSLLSLRESLINHLCHIHPAPGDQLGESTMTQLCLAIADLYIQNPEWNNWIIDFLAQCSTLGGDRTQMMLVLLKVFPEEMKSIRVGENRRKTIREELAASVSTVTQYLETVLRENQTDEEILKKVLQCLAAFLDNPALCTDSVAEGTLLKSAFHILTLTTSNALHDAATECIVAATIIAEDKGCHQSLARSVQKQIYQLVPAYSNAVANEDLYQLQNYARIFTELNETLVENMVNEPSHKTDELGSLHSLELLLLLAGFHEYSIIEKTFNVWYRLSEALFMIDDDAHLLQYKPFVERYLYALYRHSRFDTDEEDIPEESSEFMCFRMKVSETVKDVVYIVGTNECVNMMYEMLKTCSASQNSSWDEMEAALYIIAAVVHNIVPEDDGVLTEIVNAILSLPAAIHPALIVTSVELLGGCDEWLEKHPDQISKVINWLLMLVSNAKYSKYTTDAIEKIVSRSSSRLQSIFPHLMGHIAVLEQSTSRGREMELSITNLLKAAASIVVNLEPLEIRSCLNQMCEPIVVKLKEILINETTGKPAAGNEENIPTTDSWSFVAKDAVIWVDRISAIFKQVRPWQTDPNGPPIPAPWSEVASHLFECLRNVLNRYQARHRTVEHSCRALRYLVRSLGPQSCIFLEPIITELMAIYTNYPHSCVLYLASILVDEYGGIEPARPGLIHMLQHLSTATFRFLEAHQNLAHTMRDNPDTVDDFFRLAGRFVQKAPSTFFEHPVAIEIYKYALVGLSIDHQEANRSVTKFFTDHVDQLNNARRRNYRDAGVEKAEEIFFHYAPSLIYHCLHAAIFSVSGNLRRDLAEIIFMTGKYDTEKYKPWLMQAVAQLPHGNLAATDTQLAQFIANITENPLCTSSRDVFNEIRDLIQLYN